jgi:hypothetical protein
MPTMLELGRRYGGVAYTCDRDFAVLGHWLRTTPEPQWQIAFADHCHRFAFHAARLRWLVPEIAGLPVDEQLAPLAGLDPLELLDAPASTADRVDALGSHWSRIETSYAEVLEVANEVSDGAAMRWLRLLRSDASEAQERLR